MREESKGVVVLLVLLTAANIAWLAFAPAPFGQSEFYGRVLGISTAMLVVPIVLAYWCVKDDNRGFGGSALYGVLLSSFMLLQDQLLLEQGAHNAYSRVLLATAAIVGILLAYMAFKAYRTKV